MYVFALDTVYHEIKLAHASGLNGINKSLRKSKMFLSSFHLLRYVVPLCSTAFRELPRFLEIYDEHPDSNICDFILVRSTERYARLLSWSFAAGAQDV